MNRLLQDLRRSHLLSSSPGCTARWKQPNLRVIQLLLGPKKLESTVRYLGIEVDDALEISESIEV